MGLSAGTLLSVRFPGLNNSLARAVVLPLLSVSLSEGELDPMILDLIDPHLQQVDR